MEALTILPQNSEEKRILEAFLKALGISYVATEPTLEELEKKLLPKQEKIWKSLKKALLEVENGTAKGKSWSDFKTQLANENSFA